MKNESSAKPEQLDRPALGIMLRILSGALFAAMAVFVKAVSADVPVGQIVFFRSAFALAPLVCFLWIRGEFPGGLATRRPLDHLLRSALGAAAMFASFASIARLPLAEATLLGYLSPVFTAIAGVLILSERATVWRIAGVILGTLGIVALVWPELGQATVDDTRLAGFGFGLPMGLLTAFALIMVRSLSRTESPGAIAFYFVVASMIGGIATLPFGWAAPSLSQLLCLVGAGIFGGFAHICMTLAFRYTEASRLAPFEYLAILWPILADLVLFGQPLTHPFLLALPLVLSGAAVAALEAKRRASPSKSKAP
ncbi:DMT family transporter [Rhizobium wuzhouense]|uniref:EamA/RhaT family transporter n=1 Tax=Rhizobium wuzhouense TaxID=1986026 RepID=A0ABX5NTE4_9HYPH|nr:DMT family transporter [Rhizobium wuzhouense]PYB72362.1 EamA/RhaT family transporter [Rhizobium wuzhouense]